MNTLVQNPLTTDPRNTALMEQILAESPTPPAEGDMVEGPVIAVDKNALFVDLTPFGTGIIYGKEFMNAREVIKRVNVNDTIAAKVVDTTTNEDGYIELSLREARQAIIWGEAEDLMQQKAIIELSVKEANKGGLILEWQGITGFLPASQLKSEHYPRVEDGDKEKIFEELKQLVGEKLSVTIIGASPKEGKLIFSEKSPEQKDRQEMVDRFNVGDVVDGVITGIVDFGIFVKIDEGLEGLVHISEIDWSLVENPRSMFKIGDKVQAKIIEVKEGKISLSIKILKPNPWFGAEKKYHKDDTVNGVIIKYNKHGALASIEEGIAGLVHISEFGSEEKLRETLELGKTYEFTITLFDPKEQKMALSYVTAATKSKKTHAEK